MLKRLFCFGPSRSEGSGEWVVSRTTFLQTQSLYSKARVLDVLEDELEERFKAVDGRKIALEANSMRRLHRANLPMEESQHASELLGKLTAIDRSRIKLEKECAKLAHMLEAAEKSKRDAEFGKAKAEALATARGEALMRSQHSVKEAEAQQIQLSEMLRTALGHLGMSITPPGSMNTSERTISQCNAHHEVDHACEGEATSLAGRHPGPLFASPPAAVREAPGSASSGRRTPPIGFTVYSNELSDESAAPSPQRLVPETSGDSATKWKDISVVAALSPTCTATTPPAEFSVEAQAQKLAEMIIPHLNSSQLESLVHIGASIGSPTTITPGTRRKVLQKIRRPEDSASTECLHVADPENRYSSRPTHPQNHVEDDQQRQWQQAQPAGRNSHPHREPSAEPTPDVQTMFKDTDFYNPFGRGMEKETHAGGVMGPPPPRPPLNSMKTPPVGSIALIEPQRAPRRSTFSMNPASGSIQGRSINDTHDNGLIKAVGQHHDLSAAGGGRGIPENDKFARQRRAAERLVVKLNNKLPPEYKQSDLSMLGMDLGEQRGSLVGSGRRAPKGSLRRKAEEGRIDRPFHS